MQISLFFSTYSIVCFTIVLFLSRCTIPIRPNPAFCRSTARCSVYFLRASKKCSTVSWPSPHSHIGLSSMLKRYRYDFKAQWPVRSCVKKVALCHFSIDLYNFGPCRSFQAVANYSPKVCCRFIVCSPVCQPRSCS
jgi:hypothetical protein